MFLFDFFALPHSIRCGKNKYKTFKVNKTVFNEPAKEKKQNKTQKSVFFSQALAVLY